MEIIALIITFAGIIFVAILPIVLMMQLIRVCGAAIEYMRSRTVYNVEVTERKPLSPSVVEK